MRKVILLAAFALVLASCGGSAEPAAETLATPAPATSEQSEDQSSDSSPPPSVEGGEAPAEPAPSTASAAPSFDGPPAPDFALALSDGSTFNLSAEEKPVYMVFWAEW